MRPPSLDDIVAMTLKNRSEMLARRMLATNNLLRKMYGLPPVPEPEPFDWEDWRRRHPRDPVSGQFVKVKP